MKPITFSSLFLLSFLHLPSPISSLPDPDPGSVQPLKPTQLPPSTIPAFPEQSNIAGCPLNLPEDLFHGIKTACTGQPSQLHRTRCCPILATWLYYAYSATALAGRAMSSSGYNMPLLPDDSGSCVGEVDKALRAKGVELVKPNETCDVVYCYCGIRLRGFNGCSEAFRNGDKRVLKLERDCVNGLPGLGGCSKCLTSLNSLNNKNTLNSSKQYDDRTTKMHNKDCQLMGLTWLLTKNRTAYFHTVSSVLRVMMMSTDDSVPQSCAVNSDGLPLAVDSFEISNNSLSIAQQSSLYVSIVFVFSLLYAFLLLLDV